MSRTAEWKLRLFLFEEEQTTKARLELDTGTTRLTGHGTARCAPQDTDIPEIGDELAVVRAMEDLAARMKQTAYGDRQAADEPSLRESLKPHAGWLDIATS
ncbi:dsRBD fold-containing protein [Streptomyces sp. PvR034]|uniref:dsRBD fold-containing protein n=1 Tax=Streptomyces sp. PvR034 TaxID=3156401 RepID=UPI003399ECB0